MFLNSFGVNVRYLLNFGRGPSQNPQKLTLAALKFGVGNVKNRRFQLGLVRFRPGFYRNTHREPLNTTTKGFGLEPQRSTGLVFGLKSDSRRYQPVGLVTFLFRRFATLTASTTPLRGSSLAASRLELPLLRRFAAPTASTTHFPVRPSVRRHPYYRLAGLSLLLNSVFVTRIYRTIGFKEKGSQRGLNRGPRSPVYEP